MYLLGRFQWVFAGPQLGAGEQSWSVQRMVNIPLERKAGQREQHSSINVLGVLMAFNFFRGCSFWPRCSGELLKVEVLGM